MVVNSKSEGTALSKLESISEDLRPDWAKQLESSTEEYQYNKRVENIKNNSLAIDTNSIDRDKFYVKNCGECPFYEEFLQEVEPITGLVGKGRCHKRNEDEIWSTRASCEWTRGKTFGELLELRLE